MKKTILKSLTITAILAITLILLTGCDINISINENKTQTEAKQSIENEKQGKSKTEKPSVEEITSEIQHEEDTKHYMIITALDKNKNIVWKYETAKDYVAQYDTIELFGENNNIVYLNELGTIIALEKETGNVLWKNDEYKGVGSYYVFDEDGYLYLTSTTSPRLFVVSPEGKTVNKISLLEDQDLIWPSEIKITDGYNLRIVYPSHAIEDAEVNNELIMDIRDVKNNNNSVISKETVAEFDHTQIGGFEDVKTFELNTNGEVTIIFEPDTELSKKYTDAKTVIASNVKSITPLFWGNGGYGTLVMIKKDGTVAVLDSMAVESGDIKTRELNNTNINFVIQIKSLDGYGYGLVDSTGKVFVNYI